MEEEEVEELVLRLMSDGMLSRSRDDSSGDRYTIPRRIKTGRTAFGLEMKGLVGFLLTAPVLAPTLYFLPLLAQPYVPFSLTPLQWVLMLGLGIGTPYGLCKTDERTGALYGEYVFNIFWYLKSPKVLNPVWRDRDGRFVRSKPLRYSPLQRLEK